jgi:DNA/RNA-binding domain of Phe-tRNA-synthetase-like protein
MDIISRKRRMEGHNVLFPIGWDAFGLPTENYAIKHNIHPAIVTKQNVDHFRMQLKRLGFSFDYSREVDTTDPKYYKWTQWIFLKLFEKGMVFRDKTLVNYCPTCKVVLSNEDSQGGKCDVCHSDVVQLPKDVWYLRITQYADKLLEGLETVDYPESIKQQQAIMATREAYRACGKDPSRYRPSAEALRRRLLRGLELYRIDTLVDLINLVSLRTGYSIGGFDADKFEGDTLTLGIGKAGEPYEGIGRGVLNIEGMPVYRDAIGGVGTPTSDNERTKLGLETTRLLTIINGYSGKEGLQEAAEYMVELLKEFASAEDVELIAFE